MGVDANLLSVSHLQSLSQSKEHVELERVAEDPAYDIGDQIQTIQEKESLRVARALAEAPQIHIQT